MADTNADGVYVIGKSGGMWGVADSEVELRRGRALHARRNSDDSLQHIAPHFALQRQQYAKEHTADALCRSISLALPNRGSRRTSAACNET